MINLVKMSRGTFVDRFEITYNEVPKELHQITLFKGDKSEKQLEEKVSIAEWIKIQKEIMEIGRREGFEETPMYDLMLELLEEVENI